MRKPMKQGFTLIELIIVVAILGITSLLAIQKLSGVKDESRRKVNFANLKRVSAAIEAYYAQNSMSNSRTSSVFNRLDSLTVWDADDGAKGSSASLGRVRDSLLVYTNQADNVGLSAAIASEGGANAYAETLSVLGTYYLSDADATALSQFGLKYVMRGYPERTGVNANTFGGEDGAWVQGSANNPDSCSCVAVTNRGGMAVAAVNPAATSGRSPVGPDIYRSCGEDVLYGDQAHGYKVLVAGERTADNQDAFDKLLFGEGVLLAFGIGEKCELVGNASAGLDTAPVSPVMKTDEYRRYIVLLRLKHSGTARSYTSAVEYAGVMDPNGKTLSMLRGELGE